MIEASTHHGSECKLLVFLLKKDETVCEKQRLDICVRTRKETLHVTSQVIDLKKMNDGLDPKIKCFSTACVCDLLVGRWQFSTGARPGV